MRVLLLLLAVMALCAATEAPVSETEATRELKYAQEEQAAFSKLLKEVNHLEKDILAKKLVAGKAVLQTLKEAAAAKAKCSKLEGEDKEACEKRVLKRNKKESKVVSAMKDCVSGDAQQRNECVEKQAIKLLQLRPKGLAKQLKAMVTNATDTAVQKIAKAIEGATASLTKAKADLAAEKKAILQRAKDCMVLVDKFEHKACKDEVRLSVTHAKRAQRLLRRLGRCAKVFVDEPTKRARCAQLLGAEVTKALASSSSTGSSKQKVDERFPRNLREIRLVQHRFRSRLLKVRKELRAKVKACDASDSACHSALQKKLKRVARALRTLPELFRARRECLVKRRLFRQNEYKKRADEHSSLARLHTQAMRCSTQTCLDRVGRNQRQLAGTIRADRRERRRRWSALKCGPVQRLRLHRAMTPIMRRISRQHGRYSRRARLHARLQKAYTALAECSTDDCRKQLRARVERLEGYLRLLERELSMDRKKRRYHLLLRLHRTLSRLYRRAASCKDALCRRTTRLRLRKIKAALKKRHMDFLAMHVLSGEATESDRQASEEEGRRARRPTKVLPADQAPNAWLDEEGVQPPHAAGGRSKKRTGHKHRKQRKPKVTADDVDEWLGSKKGKVAGKKTNKKTGKKAKAKDEVDEWFAGAKETGKKTADKANKPSAKEVEEDDLDFVAPARSVFDRKQHKAPKGAAVADKASLQVDAGVDGEDNEAEVAVPSRKRHRKKKAALKAGKKKAIAAAASVEDQVAVVAPSRKEHRKTKAAEARAADKGLLNEFDADEWIGDKQSHDNAPHAARAPTGSSDDDDDAAAGYSSYQSLAARARQLLSEKSASAAPLFDQAGEHDMIRSHVFHKHKQVAAGPQKDIRLEDLSLDDLASYGV